MALGSFYGLNYQIDPVGQAQGQGQGQVAPPYQYGGGMPGEETPVGLNIPMEGLQYVEGMTNQVYDKYYQLNNFVANMWKNYGIDVTKPNFDSDIAVKANQVYQKAVADLHFTVQDLKQSQAMMQEDVKSGRGQFYTGFDKTATPYSRLQQSPIVSKDLLPEVVTLLEDYQKGFFSPEQAAVANQQLERIKGQLETRMQEAIQAGDQARAEWFQNNIDAIGQALYDPTQDLNRAADLEGKAMMANATRDAARIRAATTLARQQGAFDETTFVNRWEAFRTGTEAGGVDHSLSSLRAPDGTPLFRKVIRSYGDRASYGILSQTGEIIKFPHDDPETYIDFMAKYNVNWSGVTVDALEGGKRKLKSSVAEKGAIQYSPEWEENMNRQKKAIAAADSQDQEYAIYNLDQKAQRGALIMPPEVGFVKNEDDEEVEPMAIVTEVRRGRRSATGKLVFVLENGDKVVLDPKKADDLKKINKIIDSNDIGFNPNITPSYTYAGAQSSTAPAAESETVIEPLPDGAIADKGEWADPKYKWIPNPATGIAYAQDPTTGKLIKASARPYTSQQTATTAPPATQTVAPPPPQTAGPSITPAYKEPESAYAPKPPSTPKPESREPRKLDKSEIKFDTSVWPPDKYEWWYDPRTGTVVAKTKGGKTSFRQSIRQYKP